MLIIKDVEKILCRSTFKLCGSNLKFTNIICSWPGSVHDARIFENSHICTTLEQENYRGMYLLEDSGYPCRSYLLTAIESPQSEKEKKLQCNSYCNKKLC